MSPIDRQTIEILNLFLIVGWPAIPVSPRVLEVLRTRFWTNSYGRYVWLPDLDGTGPGTLFDKPIWLVDEGQWAAIAFEILLLWENAKETDEGLKNFHGALARCSTE